MFEFEGIGQAEVEEVEGLLPEAVVAGGEALAGEAVAEDGFEIFGLPGEQGGGFPSGVEEEAVAEGGVFGVFRLFYDGIMVICFAAQAPCLFAIFKTYVDARAFYLAQVAGRPAVEVVLPEDEILSNSC